MESFYGWSSKLTAWGVYDPIVSDMCNLSTANNDWCEANLDWIMIKTRKKEAAFTEDLNKTEDMLCNDPQH